jgi:hypothetical protein
VSRRGVKEGRKRTQKKIQIFVGDVHETRYSVDLIYQYNRTRTDDTLNQTCYNRRGRCPRKRRITSVSPLTTSTVIFFHLCHFLTVYYIRERETLGISLPDVINC